MVSNSSSSQSFWRTQEWADRLRRRQQRYNIARLGVVAGMVAVAGVLLVTLPESDDDVAAEPFALSASTDDINGDGDAGGESGALGLGDEVSNRDDMGGESGEGYSESTFDRDDMNAFAAAGADDAQDARLAELAAVSLDVSRFARKTTTTLAPATTKAPATAAPTTAAPTTTTEAPTTAAESTEATAEDTTSTEGETTAAESSETTGAAEGTEASESTDTTEEGGDEAAADTTETTEEETTTTAPPTTEASAADDNGYVDAGHGVKVPPILLEIRYCESRDNYTAANPYSSARGAYQFLTGSWAAYGHADRYGVSRAHLATPAQQDEAALITWQRDGTRPWNASRHCWG